MFLMLSADNQFKCQPHGRCHIFLAVAAPVPRPCHCCRVPVLPVHCALMSTGDNNNSSSNNNADKLQRWELIALRIGWHVTS